MEIRAFMAICAAIIFLVFGGPALAQCKLVRIAELPVTMNGREPLVSVKVNGKDARFLVDTGAYWNHITPGAAAKYGLNIGDLPFGYREEGLGGGTMEVSLGTAKDFTLADHTFHGVTFVVIDKGLGDEAGLIGENLLQSLDVEYDLANGVIRLFKPEGCGKAGLAYWANPAQSASVVDMDDENLGALRIMATARINGQRINVAFDTGAYSSVLTRSAAALAGVHPNDPGVVTMGYVEGVAQKSYTKSWLAPFSSFRLGDEQISNVKLMIADTKQNFDMLLGADFFLAHRILVSNSQRKVYFTYNGGPVFDMPTGPTKPTMAAAASSKAGLDAEGYSRRAAAFAARRDFDHAIADLTSAIALKPDDAGSYYQRALIHRANLQPSLALDDLNQAIKLKPDYIDALLARASAWDVRKNQAAAKTDLDAVDKAATADPDARLGLARAYAHAGFEPEAIAQLDQWIAAHPKDDDLAMALNERCWLRAQRNERLDQALADCNAGLRLLAGNPAILDSRGLVYLRLGQYDKAITDYNASLKLSADAAWALYGRGLAELKKGMKAQGDADLAAAKASSATIVDEAAKRGLTP